MRRRVIQIEGMFNWAQGGNTASCGVMMVLF